MVVYGFDTFSICFLISLIAILFIAIAMIIFPLYFNDLSWKWYRKVKKFIPRIWLIGDEMFNEYRKSLSESRKRSLARWYVRILGTILAIMIAFFIIFFMWGPLLFN
jgi:hypothetical protein